MEEVYKELDKVISCIMDSYEYKMCITLQDKMKDNDEISDLIEKVKDTQKKYIRSNYSDKIKKELDNYQERLENIPIYQIYLSNLKVVNEKIEIVKDILNDYFYNLLNEKY